MLIDLFAGEGGLPVGAIVMIAVIVLLCTLVRHLPAIIWSLRCPRGAAHYRCPRGPNDGSAVPGLLQRRAR